MPGDINPPKYLISKAPTTAVLAILIDVKQKAHFLAKLSSRSLIGRRCSLNSNKQKPGGTRRVSRLKSATFSIRHDMDQQVVRFRNLIQPGPKATALAYLSTARAFEIFGPSQSCQSWPGLRAKTTINQNYSL